MRIRIRIQILVSKLRLKPLEKCQNRLIFNTFWLVICKLMRIRIRFRIQLITLMRIRIHNTGKTAFLAEMQKILNKFSSGHAIFSVAYPGGMHRMHVHPPSPPCASPPSAMCIPPPLQTVGLVMRKDEAVGNKKKNASLFTCDLIPGEAEGRQQETCINFADTSSGMCKVPVVLYFLCCLFKL